MDKFQFILDKLELFFNWLSDMPPHWFMPSAKNVKLAPKAFTIMVLKFAVILTLVMPVAMVSLMIAVRVLLFSKPITVLWLHGLALRILTITMAQYLMYMLLIALLVCFFVIVPPRFFWNRRATRLQREAASQLNYPEQALLWPPAPIDPSNEKS